MGWATLAHDPSPRVMGKRSWRSCFPYRKVLESLEGKQTSPWTLSIRRMASEAATSGINLLQLQSFATTIATESTGSYICHLWDVIKHNQGG